MCVRASGAGEGRGSWADRDGEDGREGGGGKASTGSLHLGQGQVNEGVGPGAK